MSDNGTVNLADPESLLGMLQRGRGKGYLAALEAAPETVWPLLFECVTNDPRLDRQCEERAEYYASLIVATRMDLEPLRSYVVQNDASGDDTSDWPVRLTLATVACLATDKKNAAAVGILRDYVSYGEDWKDALYTLAEIDTLAALEQTVAVFCRRANTDANILADFKREVEDGWRWYCESDEDRRARCRYFLPVYEPWKTLCERNREFAGLFENMGIAYDRPSPPPEKPSEEYLASLSLEELFALVDESNCTRFWRVLPEKVSADDEDYLLQQLVTGNPHYMILAFRGLGELGTPRAFEALKSYIETSENADRKVRRRAFQAFEELPGSLTLPTARQWFRRKEWYLQVPAGDVLEHHATVGDVPLLIEALRAPETIRSEDFRLSSVLVALARFDGLGLIPEVERVFRETPSCFRRRDAAHALAVTAPVAFTSAYAFECLWDCHWDTRILGCEMVSLSTPGALERLREIAADPGESENVQAAARERLEGFSGG
jgi:hypothetical protein